MVMNAYREGWHTDPYGLHEARWISAGAPTKLVVDEGKESYDDVPSGSPIFEPQRFPGEQGAQDASDLLRSDTKVVSMANGLRRAAASILLHTHG